MRSVAFVGSLLVTAFASRTVLADEPPTPPPIVSEPTPSAVTVDSVHLRNGGLYRGQVTEIVPGDHVTVRTTDAETKRVPWAEIDRVIVASSPSIPPAPTATTPSAAVPPAMTGPRARVHVTSPRSVILYRKPAGTNSWVQACTSPCDQAMPLGDTYRVTGNGIAGSKEFHLVAKPDGQVEVSVDPQSTGGMVLGGIVGGVGATTAYVGFLAVLLGVSGSCQTFTTSSHCLTDGEAKDLRTGGLVALGVGAGLTAAGIVGFVMSAKTDVTQSPGHGEAAAHPPTRPLDAFVRQPTWKNASNSDQAVAVSAPTATFPFVFSGTF